MGYVIVYKKNNKRVPQTPYLDNLNQTMKYIKNRMRNSNYIIPKKVK